MDASLTTAEIDDEIIAPALWVVGEMIQRADQSWPVAGVPGRRERRRVLAGRLRATLG